MRIAFFLGAFPALSETFILDQMTSLMDRGHDVHIFAERDPRHATVHPNVLAYQLVERTRYEHLPESLWNRISGLSPIWHWNRSTWRALNVVTYGAYAASLRLAWSVRMMHGTRTFDIIHCHFGAMGLKAVQLRAVGALAGRIVTSFHGEDITNYPKRFRAGHYDPLFQRGDYFLPISDRWNGQLQALGCPMDRTRIHRMGVDIRQFPQRQYEATASAPVRIVAVGRHVEKKGFSDAIRAVATLAMPYEFFIVGDGPLRQSLEGLAQRLVPSGAIHFVGPKTQDEVAAILQTADVFLAPSLTAADGDIEGIPVSIMEAMSTGIPVVSTEHSGIPELVEDGVSGYLVREGDVTALAERLTQLVTDAGLRRRMGAQARETIEQRFDVSLLTDQLVARYRELMTLD